jgi:hypothetical protein
MQKLPVYQSQFALLLLALLELRHVEMHPIDSFDTKDCVTLSTGLILPWKRLPHAGGGVILTCQVQ